MRGLLKHALLTCDLLALGLLLFELLTLSSPMRDRLTLNWLLLGLLNHVWRMLDLLELGLLMHGLFVLSLLRLCCLCLS